MNGIDQLIGQLVSSNDTKRVEDSSKTPPNQTTSAQKAPELSMADRKDKWSTFLLNNGYDYRYEVSFEKIVTYLAMYGVSEKRGLYLYGNTGTGKTTLMKIINAFRRWTYVTSRDLVNEYNHVDNDEDRNRIMTTGARTIEPYRNWMIDSEKKENMIIDDLGVEEQANNFGTRFQLMTHIVDNRYRMFEKYGDTTYITSNLKPSELTAKYGDRTKSRIMGMCVPIQVAGRDSRVSQTER